MHHVLVDLLDLFSRKPFDAETALAAAVDAVGASDVEMRVVERATRSPRESARREPAP